MIWLARRRSLVAVAAALVLATAGVAVQGRQEPAPDVRQGEAKTVPPPPTAGAGRVAVVPGVAANRGLVKEQLALIDKALELLQMGRAERSHFAAPSFSLWERRRVETLQRAGAGKPEIVAALEKYVNSVKEEEAIAERLRQTDRASQLALYDVRFRRREAEIWLNQEKAR